MTDGDVRASLFDRIHRSGTLPELEATGKAVAEYLSAHPGDIELAMETECVAMLLSAYRSGLLLAPERGPGASRKGHAMPGSTSKSAVADDRPSNEPVGSLRGDLEDGLEPGAEIRLPPHCSNCGYPCCGAESTHVEHGGDPWMMQGAEFDAWLADRAKREDAARPRG